MDLINWDWVYEDRDTVRWDIDREHFLISFNEDKVDTFEQFNGIMPMNAEATRAIMNMSQWYQEDSE